MRRCFKPLELDKVVLKENEKVIIYVPEDKKALAIGKKSSNVQTASDLIGCKIEIN
ncbi:KH domain-containing protein [bacterium]|nr:KH domain-containing protein [bacterium]